MEGFVPPVETILDKRAKHAMVLVGAVKECIYMAILIEKTLDKLRGLRGGLHILTFTQKRGVFWPGGPVCRHPFHPLRDLDATDTVTKGSSLRP
jgi:hypothetical protein